jgi:UDP-N-acetylbacillosamine N-acetyltransferase
MKHKLVIWGTSGHALVVADIIRLRGDYELIGFLDDVYPDRHHTQFCEAPVLGGQEQLDNLSRMGVRHLLFGFGDCRARLRLAEEVRGKGFSLATAIHPQAIIASDVKIGSGTVVAAGAAINPGSRIGENVVINTCASVDHECSIEDGAHICPGAHLAGGVVVGQAAWVGIGATVIDHVRIGAGALIGAGAVVLSDIPDDVLAYGVPARIIRELTVNG